AGSVGPKNRDVGQPIAVVIGRYGLITVDSPLPDVGLAVRRAQDETFPRGGAENSGIGFTVAVKICNRRDIAILAPAECKVARLFASQHKPLACRRTEKRD